MPQESSIWFRFGYAAEQALTRVSSGGDRPRKKLSVRGAKKLPGPTGDALDRIIAAGVGALTSRLLERRKGRTRPGIGSLLRAGVAGATAALLVELTRPLLTDDELELGPDLVGEALAGAGAGMVYAALVEPRVPGPLMLRGFVYGTAEYVTAGWGGLGEVLKHLTPQERIPVVGQVLPDAVAGGRSYLEHLVFAVALAELYGEGEVEG